MSTSILVPALVGAMSVFAPPERLANAPAWPGWAETPPARAARYKAIAEAALAVAFDPHEPPLFSGPHGRKRTASLLLSIAYFESGFAPDVDVGPCYPVKGKLGARCDGGRSACLLQIQIGAGTTREGWTQAELFADREKCFRAGLHLVRRSFAKCGPKLGLDGALNAYAAGVCDTPSTKGRERIRFERRFWNIAFPAGVSVSDIDLSS